MLQVPTMLWFMSLWSSPLMSRSINVICLLTKFIIKRKYFFIGGVVISVIIGIFCFFNNDIFGQGRAQCRETAEYIELTVLSSHVSTLRRESMGLSSMLAQKQPALKIEMTPSVSYVPKVLNEGRAERADSDAVTDASVSKASRQEHVIGSPMVLSEQKKSEETNEQKEAKRYQDRERIMFMCDFIVDLLDLFCEDAQRDQHTFHDCGVRPVGRIGHVKDMSYKQKLNMYEQWWEKHILLASDDESQYSKNFITWKKLLRSVTEYKLFQEFVTPAFAFYTVVYILFKQNIDTNAIKTWLTLYYRDVVRKNEKGVPMLLGDSKGEIMLELSLSPLSSLSKIETKLRASQSRTLSLRTISDKLTEPESKFVLSLHQEMQCLLCAKPV